MKVSVPELFAQGVEAHQQGRLQVAEQRYRSIVEHDAKHPSANHNLGVLAAQNGQLEISIGYFKIALDARPENGQFWISLIDAYVKLEQFEKANDTLKRGKELGLKGDRVNQLESLLQKKVVLNKLPETNAHPLFKLFHLYRENRLHDALVLGDQMARLQDNNEHFHSLLGAINSSLGNYQKAHDHYAKSVELAPGQAATHNNLGTSLNKLGHYEKAIDSINRALELNGEYAGAYNNLAETLENIGEQELATKNFQKAIKLDPKLVETHNNLGVLYNKRQMHTEAAKCFKRALKFDPSYTITLNNCGLTYSKMGETKTAIAYYKKAILVQPNYIEAYGNLGKEYADNEQRKEAELSYKSGIKIKPSDASLHYNMGHLQTEDKKYRESLKDYFRAIVCDPQFADSYNNLALSFDMLRNNKDAQKNYERTINLRTDHIDANVGLFHVTGKEVPGWHIPMMNDGPRNQSYLAALKSSVDENTKILEIGTGSGLLAMLACQCGTKQKVITCELEPVIASTAQKIIERNGFANSIKIIPKISKELTVGEDLPEKADLIVSEIISNEFLGEGVLSTIEDAKNRLLAPNGIIIPEAGSIMINLIGGESIGKKLYVGKVLGLDLSEFNQIKRKKISIDQQMNRLEMYATDTEAFNFNFYREKYFPPEIKVLEIPVTKSGKCYGFAQWVRLHLLKDIVFENHPIHQPAESAWFPMFYPFLNPINLKKGQVARVKAIHDRNIPIFELTGIDG